MVCFNAFNFFPSNSLFTVNYSLLQILFFFLSSTSKSIIHKQLKHSYFCWKDLLRVVEDGSNFHKHRNYCVQAQFSYFSRILYPLFPIKTHSTSLSIQIISIEYCFWRNIFNIYPIPGLTFFGNFMIGVKNFLTISC